MAGLPAAAKSLPAGFASMLAPKAIELTDKNSRLPTFILDSFILIISLHDFLIIVLTHRIHYTAGGSHPAGLYVLSIVSI